jgi:hypothetical protein
VNHLIAQEETPVSVMNRSQTLPVPLVTVPLLVKVFFQFVIHPSDHFLDLFHLIREPVLLTLDSDLEVVHRVLQVLTADHALLHFSQTLVETFVDLEGSPGESERDSCRDPQEPFDEFRV